MIFYQLFEKESSTFTYLLADEASRHAVIIDPVLEMVDRDLKLINDLNLELTHVLETHVHADHVTGAHKLRKATGAIITLSAMADVDGADKFLEDGDIIRFGLYQLKGISTPGHTDSCMCYLIGNKVFTGDTILARATGRTDFQQGDPRKLYHSIQKKIFSLPEDTEIYPAHEYNGIPKTTVGIEKVHNPRIGGNKTEAEFIKIMSELKLSQPKKIEIALPANKKCGDTHV
jgi:sulfur dioxygenase